jgi:2,4-dienoyl-CoA reductase-like NADH-dependent reductase (Old Yellow Enzyme family)
MAYRSRKLFAVVLLAPVLAACAHAAPPGSVTGTPIAPATVTATVPVTGTGPAPATHADTLATVPDVSGMNRQQAQDAMQAAGFYNLREVDSKGLGRLLIVDPNWVQTWQTPAAGSRVPAGTVVTLTAVKYTDN